MIRDRIVVGLQDSKLSEKLQLDPELSLAKAINHARQSEAVKKQQALLRNDFKDSEDAKKNVDAVKVTRKNPPKLKDENGPKPKKTPLKKPPSQPSSTRCERCGNLPPHKRANCPAKNATCFKCSKRGHWGTVSKSSKTVGEVEEDENLFLGEIGTETNNTFWSVDLMLNNAQVRFKIDTGADVTVIPDKIYEALRPTPTLVKSSKTLFGPAQTSLPVRGCFVGKIQKGDKTTEQEIFVVNDARNALLGRPATNLNAKFPGLFTGLGKLRGPDYVIKLKPEAKPFALSTPRRVPVPLLTKVKEELSRMEQMQIISKVDESTEWCAGMVVVPKANGKVRICVDLTNLNESINESSTRCLV